MRIIFKCFAITSLIFIVPCGLFYMKFAAWIAFGIGWLFVLAIAMFLFEKDLEDYL